MCVYICMNIIKNKKKMIYSIMNSFYEYINWLSYIYIYDYIYINISDVLLWTPTYGRAKAGRPARTYIQQLCEDTGCNPEDLPKAMNDREKWRERVRDIRVGGTTWWWWWWWYIYIYIYIYIWQQSVTLRYKIHLHPVKKHWYKSMLQKINRPSSDKTRK